MPRSVKENVFAPGPLNNRYTVKIYGATPPKKTSVCNGPYTILKGTKDFFKKNEGPCLAPKGTEWVEFEISQGRRIQAITPNIFTA